MDRFSGLLTATAECDRAAFHLLYDCTSAKLFGTILLILADHAVAQDVLQDAYVRIWQKASSFDPARGRPMT